MASLLEFYQDHKIYSLDSLISCACGGVHSAEEHWKFIEEMPQAPAALIDDLLKMGHYTPETLELAEQFTDADFRKALILQMIAGAPPEQRQLCNDLIKQAGGLEEAFSAAFGPSAAEFFGDMTRASKFRRRDFLTKVAATAAIVTLASW